MTNYYDILEIQKTASSDDIKKAYKKMALKWHPDRNPDNKTKAEEKFKEIAEAYDTLSDPEKRRMYDLTGSTNFESTDQTEGFPPGQSFSQSFSFGPGVRTAHFTSSSSGIDANKIFKEFFGNTNPFGNSNMQGFSPMSSRQSRFDNYINSEPDYEPEIRIQKIPFTLEELYTGCVKKLKINDTQIEMNVMPGWKDGEGATYSGIIPNTKLKLAVQELSHNTFKRDGDDLITTIRITYTEALNGFTKQITKLDGTKITVTLPKIKSSDYIHIINSEGMPIRKNKKQVGYGNLHVNFIVTF